jgi:CHASE3 domain sensor protein
MSTQRDSCGWVQHTNEVLRNISAVERAILEAESGERGYLLTGESSYLNRYSRSQAEFRRAPGNESSSEDDDNIFKELSQAP